MDITIKRILGEEEEILDPETAPLAGEEENGPDRSRLGSEDAEIDELSNLWTTGNKGEVIRRYMDMNNEDSVKLVFAIGLEGALELARMVDQMVEQGESPEDSAEAGESDSTEPEYVEPASPTGSGIPINQIIGKTEEVEA